jgi:hypothetical protein
MLGILDEQATGLSPAMTMQLIKENNKEGALHPVLN